MSAARGFWLGLALLCATPLIALGSSSASWQGVSLGESVADVRKSLGPPLLLRTMPDGSYFSWNRTASDNAYMLLSERDGKVNFIRVLGTTSGVIKEIVDPFGIALGDASDKLDSVRGKPWRVFHTGDASDVAYLSDKVVWSYTTRDGTVHAIMLVSTTPLQRLVASPVRDPHDGSSTANAYVLNARTDGEGVRFEHFYVSTMAGCNAPWEMTKQSLVTQKDRQYDALDLSCPATNAKRTVYFDITSYYGKLGD